MQKRFFYGLLKWQRLKVYIIKSGRKNQETESDQTANQYTWEDLKKRPVPLWFDDAKFGIMIHWDA